MDAPRLAVRLAITGVAVVIAALLAVALLDGGAAARSPVVGRDGGAFSVPDEPGAYEAT